MLLYNVSFKDGYLPICSDFQVGLEREKEREKERKKEREREKIKGIIQMDHGFIENNGTNNHEWLNE